MFKYLVGQSISKLNHFFHKMTMTLHLLLLACLALTSGLGELAVHKCIRRELLRCPWWLLCVELQVQKRYPTSDLEKRRSNFATALSSLKGKFSNADSEYNADNKKIIEHMGLTDVALTGGTSSDKKDAIEYSDGG